jgi:nucleotide-binding universal stress UspA family protein
VNYHDYMFGKDARRELLGFINEAADEDALRRDRLDLMLTVGETAHEILRVAAEKSADLIVIGTHGLSGYRKMFFGSTTERVLRRSHAPVLAVPLPRDLPMARKPLVLEPGPVLAPIDFSEASREATRVASAVARNLGRGLHLLHVVPPLKVVGRLSAQADEREKTRILEARRQLLTFAQSVDVLAMSETLVLNGQPAQEIGQYAADRHVSVIVMSLTGHGGPLNRPGSVAYRLLCLSPAPVLALPLKRAADQQRLESLIHDVEQGVVDSLR